MQRVTPLVPGKWYRDPELRSRYRVVTVYRSTVQVVDQWGNRRLVNRMLAEWQLRQEK